MNKSQAYDIVMQDLDTRHAELLERAKSGENVNQAGTELVNVMSYLNRIQAGLSDVHPFVDIVE